MLRGLMRFVYSTRYIHTYIHTCIHTYMFYLLSLLETTRLALNISKTNYVIFHLPSKKINEFFKIKLGWKAISQVNCIKYLGIFIDSTLSWKPHVTELSKKTCKKLWNFL